MLRLASTCAAAALAACGFNPTGGTGDDDVIDPDGGGDDGGGDAGDVDGGDPMLVPSNGATRADLDGVDGAVMVAANRTVVFNSDDGSIVSFMGATATTVRGAGTGTIDGIHFRVQLQSNGAPQIGVFALTSLTIVNNGSLRVGGDRPVLLLVRDAATIDGEINVGGGLSGAAMTTECQTCGGAGAGDGGTIQLAAGGCAPGIAGSYDIARHETGGGGGGFGFSGAPGGDSDAPGGGVTPIGACTGPELTPLRGGSGGGRGGYDVLGTLGGTGGGGGGGALQLTSFTSIALGDNADLYAGGAGGLGSDPDYGGGGGGSGGGFLLEAPTVNLQAGARITANGGGGGSGRTAARGENGTRSAIQRASGGSGTGVGMNDGRGGLGGIAGGGMAASQGNGAIDGTGGGGGGAGLVRINTIDTLAVPAGAVVSPPHTAGAAIQQ